MIVKNIEIQGRPCIVCLVYISIEIYSDVSRVVLCVVLHQNFPLAKWQYRAQLKQGPAQTSSHFFILTSNSNNSIFVFWKVFIFSRNGIIFELYLEYRTVLASLTGLDKTSFWWVQTSTKWVSMYLINNTLFLIFVISSIVWKWIMDMKIFSVAGIWELDENMIGIFHSGRDTTYGRSDPPEWSVMDSYFISVRFDVKSNTIIYISLRLYLNIKIMI